MGWHGPFAIGAAILAGALLALGMVLVATAPGALAVATLALGLAVAPLAAVLGVVVARRRAAPVIGALLAFLAVIVAAVVAREAGAGVLAARPADAQRLAWLVAFLAEGAIWVLVAVALLLLFFPNGQLPSRRWRWVPAIAIAGAFVVQAHGAFDSAPFRPPLQALPRPFGPPPPWLEVIGLIAFVTVLALVPASVVSLVLRYRRGDELARARIKWLALGGAGIALFPFVCGAEILVTGSPGLISAAVGIAGLVGIPIGIAIAMLRHDLYDIDKALAGTAAWVLLSVVLLVLYGVASVAAGVALGQGSAFAAAVAAALCALALAPLRRRLASFVDRRLYPRRRAAIEALDTLYRDVSAGTAEPESLQDVLRSALRDEDLVVGYRVPGTDVRVDRAGVEVVANGVPVELAGAAIGVVVPGPAGAASSALIGEVVGRAAPLVEVVRLRLELGGALREVEASRARLLQIGYEERRRLERDLHDGAQQRLVSLGMAIRLAQRHLDDGSVNVDGLLDETVTQLSTAVAELRQLAQGIRPSSLDDGLEAALARLVQNVPVSVETDIVAGPLPDEVATTAYFVISEAVANAVKHANASRIGLRVVRADNQVLVRVSDDGRGGAALQPGSGLADRVAALGGSIAITSPIGRGTIVEAALPCAS
jgi:signal transduction histidine kinase